MEYSIDIALNNAGSSGCSADQVPTSTASRALLIVEYDLPAHKCCQNFAMQRGVCVGGAGVLVMHFS